jgi:indolepyruvate ferredoxin oxidoreductase alpha subunit
MTELAETTDLNRLELGEDRSLGIITSSTSYQYVREVFGEKVSVLKLGLSWPMPVKKIKDFAAQVDQLMVIEELEPIIENHCRQIGVEVIGKEKIPMVDELTQGVIARSLGQAPKATVTLEDEIPGRPPVMCAGCPHRGMFYTLSKNKCMVYGDIGCYTLGVMPPLNALDLNICMGASCSGLHGFNLAGGAKHEKHSVAVIGDSTFAHSGITGITDIAYNKSNSTVIILDNSITGMTGHQQNPTTGKTLRGEPAGQIDLEALCHAVGFERVRVVDPNDLKAADKVLKEELEAEAPSIIISRSPCVMLKSVEKKPPLKVDNDRCNGCGLCMKIGCPALSLRGDRVEIDRTQCVGCQVCMQMCHRDALLV